MRSDLYARKSTKDAGRSVSRQERTWRADCAAEGIDPGRVFVDPDFSASRHARKDRPDYAALLEHIRANECQMISLWEVSRGSRQMGEWVAFLDLCRERGVRIRVLGDGDDAQTYDPRRQRDRESLIREGMAAEGEVEQLRSRTKTGTADAARQGRPPGPLLYGYRRVYGAPTQDSVSMSGTKRREITQVINEPEAEIVRLLAEGARNGVPLDFMARVLNAWEVPTASGKGRWAGHGINRLLRNPGYEGHRVHDGRIATHNAWPAILDPVTAAEVRSILETPGRRHSGSTSLKYMLSGAVLCGTCRKPMKADHWKTRLLLACGNSACYGVGCVMALIEETVSEIVIGRLRRQDALAAFTPVANPAAVGTAQAALSALTGRLEELHAEAAKPDGPSMALVAAAERELLPKIEKAKERLRVLRTPPALRGYDPADLAERWYSDRYTVGEKRAVVMTLAEIVVSPVGKGGRWSFWRLAESRWHGDSKTWGEHWRDGGVA